MSTLQDYEVIAPIGCGSYGTCKKIRRKCDNKICVWKEIDYALMTEIEKKMVITEVTLLLALDHPFIVCYYGHILDMINKTLYIIMEYCEGGDLQCLVKKSRRQNVFLCEDYIWKVLCQLTIALHECHGSKQTGQKILHRDIKPANVFLTSDNAVKLGDFGLARVLSSNSTFAKTFVGTPYYMSPEVVKHEAYNDKSDVWSLGCLIYELCTLIPPFTAASQALLAKKITEGKCRRIPPQYSESLNDIIMKMLTVVPDKRPTIEKVMQIPALKEKFGKYHLEVHIIPNQGGFRKNQIPKLALENKVGNIDMKKKLNDLAAKEKLLKERERAIVQKEHQLAKNFHRLEVREKMLNEKRERMDEYITICRHLGLQDYPFLRDNHRDSRRLQQVEKCATLPTFKNYSNNTSKKRVHFQSGNVTEAKLQGTCRLEQNSTNSTSDICKENFNEDQSIRPMQTNTMNNFKSSLRRATNRALRLRIAEIESRMCSSPF